jgi:hypothetical protein
MSSSRSNGKVSESAFSDLVLGLPALKRTPKCNDNLTSLTEKDHEKLIQGREQAKSSSLDDMKREEIIKENKRFAKSIQALKDAGMSIGGMGSWDVRIKGIDAASIDPTESERAGLGC